MYKDIALKSRFQINAKPENAEVLSFLFAGVPIYVKNPLKIALNAVFYAPEIIERDLVDKSDFVSLRGNEQ